jgi:hypothetical protein
MGLFLAGYLIYFTYGIRNSKEGELQRHEKEAGIKANEKSDDVK